MPYLVIPECTYRESRLHIDPVSCPNVSIGHDTGSICRYDAVRVSWNGTVDSLEQLLKIAYFWCQYTVVSKIMPSGLISIPAPEG